MNRKSLPVDPVLPVSAPLAWLERLTGVVLLAVLTALSWMIFVSYAPEALRLATVEAEVWLVLGLLTAALLLVSVVALWHTHR
jgi:hypothetical protein